MKRRLVPSVFALALAASFLPVAAHGQPTITAWNFDNLSAGFNPHPAPSTGSGIAAVLGMDNNYPTPGTSTNISDILSSTGSSAGGTSLEWRIRGGKNTPTAANGWSTQAPIGTQGAEFDASTAGYSGIHITFDVETSSTAALANLQLEYTINGTTWANAVISYSGAG